VIVARCRQFQDLLARLKRAEADQKMAATLSPRCDELQDRSDKLGELLARLRVLREAGLISQAGLPNADALPAFLVTVRQNLASDPFSITKGHAYKGMMKALDGVIDGLRLQLTTTWRDWVDRQTARLDDGELARYGAIPAYKSLVAEIRQLSRRAAEVPNRLPASQDELAEANQVFETLRERIEGLPRTEDSEVRAFLDSANRPEGAGLDRLTPAVLAWLDQESLLPRYRIFAR
jgi:hypothetical protein